VNCEVSHFVFDNACPQVSLSDDTFAVGSAPYAPSVISRGDASIGEVNYLVSVFELTNDLGLSSDCAVGLFLHVAGVVDQH